jgi:hypothetical protein
LKKNDNSARKFELRVPGSSRDLGELQYNVLLCISEKHYSEAFNLLTSYQAAKSGAKIYAKRTDALYKHAGELVNAIETKKSVPQLASLAQSKQEEIHQKALENWEDLKICLRRLKSIEHDMAVADARSSIWVFKAFIFSFMIIMTVFIVNEGFRSFGASFLGFMRETFQLIIDSTNTLF